MKIQDIIYFKYLSECASFTKTAEAFYVSQPSISIALKRLEEQFGAQLITRDRSTKSFQLTAAGEILYRRASEMIELLEVTKREITNVQSQRAVLGFLPTIGGYYMPKLLPDISEFVSTMELLEEESSDEMLKKINENQVSIALIGSDKPAFDEHWIEQYPLEERELKVCVSVDHPLVKEEAVDASMLQDYLFICLDKGYTHQRIFDTWAQKNGIDMSKVSYTKEIQTADSFISSGVAIGLMIDLLVRDRTDIVTIPLKKAPKFYISLVVSSQAQISPYQERFNQTLIKGVKEKFPHKKTTS